MEGTAPNNKLQRTRRGQDGASPLNSVLGRLVSVTCDRAATTPMRRIARVGVLRQDTAK